MLHLLTALLIGQVTILQNGVPVGLTDRINCTGGGVTCAKAGTTNSVSLTVTPGGGGAPATAQYWTGAADGTLTAEIDLSALATGLVINTAGTPSAYAGASCSANQYATQTSASGALTCAQVSTSQLSGTITNGQLASSYSGTGVCGANQWASTLNGNAAPTCTQPAFSSLSGAATDTQLASSYSGIGTCVGTFARALGRNVAPTCEAVSLTADVGGVLGVANGGTGASSLPACNAGQELSSDGGSLYCRDLSVAALPAYVTPKPQLAVAFPRLAPSLVPGLPRLKCNAVRRFNCGP